MSVPSPLHRLLPLAALTLTALGVLITLLPATESLGYDYQAYVRAAQRFLDGQPLYDPTVEAAGGFAIFLYPPPFALAMVPFAALPDTFAMWLWIGVLGAALLIGVAVLPVSRDVRWLVLLLGGFDWPVLYGLRLGQVSALLFLLFALCWRWLDRQDRIGSAAAVGALIKVQPGLLLVWAVLTSRWRAVAVGVIVLLIAALISTLVVGVGAWADYARLLGAVSEPVTTEHNFTPGAIAYQLGVPTGVAGTVQLVAMVATVAAVLAAIRWATPEASLIVSIVASQLLSPLLWDHYAVVLLIPVAWLLSRGHLWAIVIPLATWFPLVGVTPPAAYPIAFLLALVATALVGWREARLAGTNGRATAGGSVG
jgi:hypothetical protein